MNTLAASSRLRPALLLAIPVALALLAAGCRDEKKPDSAATTNTAPRHGPRSPGRWPKIRRSKHASTSCWQTMTVEEKVGQIVQGDIASLTPDDVRKYRLGSVLAGGGSDPGGKYNATPRKWLALADAFYEASMDTRGGGKAIPILFGIDAVHGQSNIVGATVFPHNIGLGATRNPELMRARSAQSPRSRRAPPAWNGPSRRPWPCRRTTAGAAATKAIPRIPKSSPAMPARWSKACKAKPAHPTSWMTAHVMASVKHYLGDGGTSDGKDQGDTQISEAVLRDVHAAGYPPAIAAGAQAVMASFNSYQRREDARPQGAADRCAEGADELRRLRRRRLERPRPGRAAAPTPIARPPQCGPGHGDGAGQLEGLLRKHGGARRRRARCRWRGSTMRCGASCG